MKYHLDFSISLLPSKRGLGPGWSIAEHNDNDDPSSSPELIPWHWSIGFNVQDLCIVADSRQVYETDESTKTTLEFEVHESIVGTLKPILSEYRQEPKISMLGTNRIISQYSITFYQISGGERERCEFRGGVASSSDDWGCDDFICMFVYLHREGFNNLKNRVLNKQIKSAEISVGHCAGLYSTWSPEIHADVLKVFCDPKQQTILDAYGLRVPLSNLGDVGTFRFRIISDEVCASNVQAAEVVADLRESEIRSAEAGGKTAFAEVPAMFSELIKRNREIVRNGELLFYAVVVLILLQIVNVVRH